MTFEFFSIIYACLDYYYMHHKGFCEMSICWTKMADQARITDPELENGSDHDYDIGRPLRQCLAMVHIT